jgi:AbrB family looped-hinge helix DNA binding protein
MQAVARVSRKGQVVIPAELRKKLNITRLVVIREEGGKVVMEPVMSMEDAFGIDGDKMREVAKEISRDRRAEVESGSP